jgi:hypothetical protein
MVCDSPAFCISGSGSYLYGSSICRTQTEAIGWFQSISLQACLFFGGAMIRVMLAGLELLRRVLTLVKGETITKLLPMPN